MKNQLLVVAGTVAMIAASVHAQTQTVAYWRFEDGTADTDVPHASGNGIFEPSILDVSGNGNHLSVWSFGDFAGYRYRAEVGATTIPGTGEPNTLSVKNTGGAPGMFTNSFVSIPGGIDMETWSPRAWTIEATFKIENGGYRTVVGRDGRDLAIDRGNLAALYFQGRPDNVFTCLFVDVMGNVHEASSAPGAFQTFDFPSNPDGIDVPWTNAAAVSDGTTLSVYLNGALVATADLSASADPSLVVGVGGGGDWHAGGWSVGRGFFDGGHTDRAYGFIDEVRFTDGALSTEDFLFPFSVCAPDFNGDGFLDFFDYSDYVDCFETGNCVPGRDADFNGDDFVDFFDYADFVSAFEVGC